MSTSMKPTATVPQSLDEQDLASLRKAGGPLDGTTIAIDDLALLLIDLMERYGKLLERETALISDMRVSEAAPLADAKQLYAAAYDRAVRSVRDRADEARLLADPLKQRLEMGRQRFANQLTANLGAIDRAQRTTQQVVDLIVGTVRKAQNATRPTYSHLVAGPQDRQTMGSQPLSVSVDRRL